MSKVLTTFLTGTIIALKSHIVLHFTFQLMEYRVGVPMVVQLISAAKHDHYLLKEVYLPQAPTLPIDHAYIDIA